MFEQHRLEKLFQDFFTSNGTNFPLVSKSQNYPPMNVTSLDDNENGHEYYNIEYALAGFSRDEITVDTETIIRYGNAYNTVTVRAKKASEPKTYMLQNIAFRDVERTVILSNRDSIIDASYVDGILTLKIERDNDKYKSDVKSININ